MVIASVSLHPALVIFGAPVKHVFIHHRNAQDLAEEIDHLFGARQTAQVAMDDDAVEAVVYKNEQAVEQLCEQLHRSPPGSCFSNKIIGEAVGGVNRTPPGAARKERKGFQRERNRRFRSLWATSQTATNAREYPEARIFKFQICLASASGPGGRRRPTRVRELVSQVQRTLRH